MFALFAYPSIDPCGGWHDLIGIYISVAEAEEIASNLPNRMNNWHIADIERRSIVKNGRTD